MASSPELTVRRATHQDAESITQLSGQLGYPSSLEDITQRLAEINGNAEHAIYVADFGGVLLGWIHVLVSHSLLADMPAEVSGLVIDEHHRGRGIGKMLMEHAERWARSKGCRSVRLRSNVVRTRAHNFYERLGYRVIKSQKAFCKDFD